MKTRIKALLKMAIRSRPYGTATLRFDALLALLVRALLRGDRSDPKTYAVCIVAPPGAGNIGDQALIEAALDHVAGRAAIVVRDVNTVTVPDARRNDVDLLALPHLVYGLPLVRLPDTLRFLSLASKSRECWIIGADIMDGAYNPLASVARFSCAYSASIIGASSRVLGFSWNNSATKSSAAAAEIASRSVILNVRDPSSHRRLIKLPVHNTRLVADTVFARSGRTATSGANLEWVEAAIERGRRIIVVNASGLLASRVDQAEEYRVLFAHLNPAHWSVILLPHVDRPGNSDSEVLLQLRPHIQKFEHLHVDVLLPPDQVAAVVSRADLVVTGRMHLAVLSILAGTVAITLASQGKVEGLYETLGYPELCVQPVAGFGSMLVETFELLESKDLLDRGLPESGRTTLIELAEDNFR